MKGDLEETVLLNDLILLVSNLMTLNLNLNLIWFQPSTSKVLIRDSRLLHYILSSVNLRR